MHLQGKFDHIDLHWITVHYSPPSPSHQVEEAKAREAQKKAAAFEGVSIDVLREDVEAALSEATLAEERQALLQLEVGELTRQRDELAEHLGKAVAALESRCSSCEQTDGSSKAVQQNGAAVFLNVQCGAVR